MNRVEWMKGICHIWSRGRHFSPSMPGDRYLKLSSCTKAITGSKSREHCLVRRCGTTSRGTALLVFCLRMRSFPRTQVLIIFLGKSEGCSQVVEHHGVLRVKGRIANSPGADVAWNQAILPRDHPVTMLIVRHIHELIGHLGLQHLISTVQEKLRIPSFSDAFFVKD